ncbi:MAG: hypothetical protein ACK526_05630 [Planctomyces sp.]
MAIDVSCLKCSKAYRVNDQLAGKKFRCKQCQSAVEIPPAACEEADIEFEDDSLWTQPPPRRSLPPGSRSKKGEVAAPAAGIFTLRKLFGVLALLVAGMMCMGMIIQILKGNVWALGGIIVVWVVGSVAMKWLRT